MVYKAMLFLSVRDVYAKIESSITERQRNILMNTNLPLESTLTIDLVVTAAIEESLFKCLGWCAVNGYRLSEIEMPVQIKEVGKEHWDDAENVISQLLDIGIPSSGLYSYDYLKVRRPGHLWIGWY